VRFERRIRHVAAHARFDVAEAVFEFNDSVFKGYLSDIK
jgi:hypothetical protein